MEVPKKLHADFGEVKAETNGRSHAPAGYYSDSEDEFDDDLDSLPPSRLEAKSYMTPPKKLTVPEIGDEERNRYMREYQLLAAEDAAYPIDESMYKTPNDTILRNLTSFQSGDPVHIARQVKHLHNRVKLVEEELQTQHNRQIFLFGILSAYLLFKGARWLSH